MFQMCQLIFLTYPNSKYHADFPNHLSHCKIICIRRLTESIRAISDCTQRRYILQNDFGIKKREEFGKKITSGEIEFELLK